ncbi:hypothetical protein A1F94_009062 [Pyrenophora tritici-repentis]|nr:hypothetical protein A1F94_009062 [Pyrenophora tritici-repentis]
MAPSIRAKLRSDQLSGADAFDYVWDRLEQPQQASVLHLRHQAEENNTWDVEDIFSFFQRLCHNPREQQEAIQRFSLVRQRDEESLIAYLARFERLAYEAGASTWPDTSRISVLHRGLRSSLRQSLEESNDSLFTIPYDEYVELVQSLDRRSRRPQPPQQPKQVSRQLDPMDVDPIQVQSARVSSVRKPARRLSASSSDSSDERRAYRLSNNLCLYCGAADHWISSCPRSSSRSSSRPAPALSLGLAPALS